MAEREGFEPSEHASVHLISNQARSASSGTSPGAYPNALHRVLRSTWVKTSPDPLDMMAPSANRA